MWTWLRCSRAAAAASVTTAGDNKVPMSQQEQLIAALGQQYHLAVNTRWASSLPNGSASYHPQHHAGGAAATATSAPYWGSQVGGAGQQHHHQQ
jgi:hypothetical protein